MASSAGGSRPFCNYSMNDSPQTGDDRFEFGLSCLLDGIAAKLAQ
jgi:hypothetical protein